MLNPPIKPVCGASFTGAYQESVIFFSSVYTFNIHGNKMQTIHLKPLKCTQQSSSFCKRILQLFKSNFYDFQVKSYEFFSKEIILKPFLADSNSIANAIFNSIQVFQIVVCSNEIVSAVLNKQTNNIKILCDPYIYFLKFFSMIFFR